ncbi:MAG: CAP domain-containing protein [Tannerella sp.]|nr:CAP domain-containing protein [Tannerella sp.]
MRKRFSYGSFFSLSFVFAMAVSCRSRVDGGAVWHEVCHKEQEVAYLSAAENDVICEINKVRTNPKAYINYLKEERAYYHGLLIKRPGKIPILTREGRAALEVCIAALEEATPAEALLPDENLCQAAGLLAAEQAKTGAMGHVCADGRTLKNRILQFCGDKYMQMAENISYGSWDARSIVIRFLIDDGIPGRGHRINLMNSSYTHCGVAMAKHPIYRYVCVIDFAAY